MTRFKSDVIIIALAPSSLAREEFYSQCTELFCEQIVASIVFMKEEFFHIEEENKRYSY